MLNGQAQSVRLEAADQTVGEWVHTPGLLLDITAFETYSLECEDTDPEQQHLHAYLRQATASARALFEAALERVAEVDGLDLDQYR